MSKSIARSFRVAAVTIFLFGFKNLVAQQKPEAKVFTIPEPENIGILQDSVKAYVASGRYYTGITIVVDSAKAYIETRMGANNPAIVLDIDETSLSNYEYEIKYNFGNRGDIWKEWVLSKKDTAIGPTLSLARWAVSKDIAVFFITGRPLYNPDTAIDPTVLNLKQVGYPLWRGIYFKPEGERLSDFKTAARKHIEEDLRYTIIVNLGDQYSDLVGGYYARGFKLPDPMYYVP